jgi:fluoroquinolone resistance protein
MLNLDQTFDRIDFKNSPLPKGEYENCTFKNSDFSNANLFEYKFTDCRFEICNLSNAKINQVSFRDCKFYNGKMLGLLFDQCAPFGFSVYFENCTLNHSSFFKVKLKKTLFRNCQLQEVDFSEADLTTASFDNSDLSGAIFENSILEKADFRTATNYSFNPELNKMKKARFSLAGLPGLLAKYDIEIED